MTNLRIFTSILTILGAFILLLQDVSTATVNMETSRKSHRPITHSAVRIPIHYSKLRPESFSDIFDDDDLFDMSKRQIPDDYGHLRFGKRGEDFDDYGHLRFGRSGGDKK